MSAWPPCWASSSCTRESLEHVPATELVAATEELGKRSPDPGMLPLPFLPVVDGVLLPEHPLAAVANGAAAGVDLVIGTNRDELTLFGLGNPALMALDEDGVTRWVGNAAPDMPEAEVVDAYRTVRHSRGSRPSPTPSGSPSAPTSSSAGRASSWPPRTLPGARVRSSTCSIGHRRRSAGSSARVTRSSCRSCSVPWVSLRCRSSPVAVRPSRRCRARCSGHGWLLPPRETPAMRRSAPGAVGIRSIAPP